MMNRNDFFIVYAWSAYQEVMSLGPERKYGLIGNNNEFIIPLVCDAFVLVNDTDLIYVQIRGNNMYADLHGNLYEWPTEEPLNCTKCPCYNDKLISGFCCQFFKD